MITAHLIVNVFNGEEYLRETLESLVNQDYENVKIHCVDNHSSDNTVAIISSFKSEHENINIYKTPEHMPLVSARLYILSEIFRDHMSPSYFAFCDADDLWEPTWISKLMKGSEDGYDLLFSNGYRLIGEQALPVNSCLSQMRASPFICPIYLQSCLFSSELLKDKEPIFDNSFSMISDTELWIRKGKNLTYMHLSDRLFYYRVHENSLGQNNFFPLLSEQWRILKKHKLPVTRFVYGFSRQLLNKFFSK